MEFDLKRKNATREGSLERVKDKLQTKFDHDEQILRNHMTMETIYKTSLLNNVVDKHILTSKKIKKIEKEL